MVIRRKPLEPPPVVAHAFVKGSSPRKNRHGQDEIAVRQLHALKTKDRARNRFSSAN